MKEVYNLLSTINRRQIVMGKQYNKTVQHIKLRILRNYIKLQNGINSIDIVYSIENINVPSCLLIRTIDRFHCYAREEIDSDQKILDILKMMTHYWWPKNYDRNLELFKSKLNNFCLEII